MLDGRDDGVEILSVQAADGGGRRVGVLSLISSDCDTVPAMAEKARRFHDEAAETLSQLGFHVVRPQGPTRTPEEGVQHLRALDRAGAEAIVLYVADWSYATTAAWSALLQLKHAAASIPLAKTSPRLIPLNDSPSAGPPSPGC